jgi:L-asparaginase
MSRIVGRPRVAVIGTGGSISFVARFPLDLFEYGDYARIQQVDELLATVPELDAEIATVPVPFRAISSTKVATADWLELNEVVHRTIDGDPGLAGVVITHGTATLEETAYFLNLTLKVDLPVVLVGAQRPTGGLSSDAPINLLNACRTAAAPAARGLGVLVVLNDQIQAAREVTKTSTFRLETFRSPDVGILGHADPDGRVVIYRRPTRRSTTATEFDVRGRSDLPRVDIAYSYAGSDGTAIDAFVSAGARAVVIASLAPGKLTPEEKRAAARALRANVAVIVSTRAGSGRVVERAQLREQGHVAADDLNPQKARVLAMLGLTQSSDRDELQRIFDEY